MVSDKTFYPVPDDMMQKKATKRPSFAAKYPWKDLPIGQGFRVPAGQVKYGSMVSLAYKMSKKLGRDFGVKGYGKGEGLFVFRRADPPVQSEIAAMDGAPIQPVKPEVSNWVKPVLPPGYEMNAHGLIRSPEGKYYHDIKDIPK